MDEQKMPALTPLEGAMLPAIEMKHADRKPFAALHAAQDRWKHAVQPIGTPEERPAPQPKKETERLLSRAAYAYAMRKRKR